VPLLGWFGLVFFQNGVDHAHPRPQLGPLRGWWWVKKSSALGTVPDSM
jgi:hypothetical protein